MLEVVEGKPCTQLPIALRQPKEETMFEASKQMENQILCIAESGCSLSV